MSLRWLGAARDVARNSYPHHRNLRRNCSPGGRVARTTRCPGHPEMVGIGNPRFKLTHDAPVGAGAGRPAQARGGGGVCRRFGGGEAAASVRDGDRPVAAGDDPAPDRAREVGADLAGAAEGAESGDDTAEDCTSEVVADRNVKANDWAAPASSRAAAPGSLGAGEARAVPATEPAPMRGPEAPSRAAERDGGGRSPR